MVRHRGIFSQVVSLINSNVFNRSQCPYVLRRVVVWDEKNKLELVLLPNHLEFSVTSISGIYKERC